MGIKVLNEMNNLKLMMTLYLYNKPTVNSLATIPC